MNGRFLTAVALVVAVPTVALAAGPSASSTPPTPAPAASASAADGALDRAKDLFRKGNELMKAGDLEAALDYFLRSRALVPSVPNTMNAAIALDRLDRADEALDLYEHLVADFAGKLEEDDKRAVSAAMSTLRKRVGTVDVSANVDADVVIDGRRRGAVPLTSPIAVRPGKHLVRIVKDGYSPAEATVNVAIGQNVAVDLKLTALAASGRLAVTEKSGRTDVDVIIDGAPVGPAPWQGTLAPGRHLVALRGKDVGTAPVASIVIASQSVPVELLAVPIGPVLRLDPDPATASLVLDGTELGVGAWDGRLPLGTHHVEASDEGYFAGHVDFEGSTRGPVPVRLRVDGDHPRWRKADASHLRVELFGGLGFASSLGGTAESSCPGACTSHKNPSGGFIGARGAYELPIRLRVELAAGYLGLSSKASRTVPSGSDYTYAFDDQLSLTGPFVAAGLGYALPLGNVFSVSSRFSVGAFFARSSDTISGNAVRGADSAPISVDSSGSSVRGIDFFVMPELGGELHFGEFHVGATLGLGIFLADGPTLPSGETNVQANCHVTGPTTGAVPLACIPGSNVVTGERAYERFLLWMPQLQAGWTF